MIRITYLIGALCLLAPLRVDAAERPDVKELLDKLTQALDPLRSCIVETESTNKGYHHLPKQPIRNTSSKTSEVVRVDSNGRKSRRTINWDLRGFASNAPTLPKEQGRYVSVLLDGRSVVQYVRDQRSDDFKGRVNIVRPLPSDGKENPRASGDAGRALLGYFSRDGDERIDSVLRRAERILLRKKREMVGGSETYVISAVIDGGKYTVWIDPEHGYNIAQARVVKRKGDGALYNRKPLKYENRITLTLKDIRFRMIDDVWIPMEATAEGVHHAAANNYRTWSSRAQHTKVILNPDHDALDSFIPDDIREGAPVFYDFSGESKHTWREGKPVPKEIEKTTKLKDRKAARPGTRAKRQREKRKRRSDSDGSINPKKLNRVIHRVNYADTLFSEIIDDIRDRYDLNILVRWPTLELVGIYKDEATVDLQLRGITLRKALELILDNVSEGEFGAKLGYDVSDGVMTISTTEDLNRRMVTRIYNVRDLMFSSPRFDGAPQLGVGRR
jgi:hypothetical protein